jgi:hypothetical protein
MSLDSSQSVYRERLLEHLLLGHLMRHSWLSCGASLEVSHPMIDRAGHDVVLDDNQITRHVQFKSATRTAKTSRQTIHLELGRKPSGCVVWILFEPASLELGPFLFFGGMPGTPLPAITNFPVAKHTKGNAQGVKLERPNLRVIPRREFKQLATVHAIYTALFGL